MAGSGGVGYHGDGGPAVLATLNFTRPPVPASALLAADNRGNLFIADFGNSVIRKVDSSGIITTVVGNGTGGFTGDGGRATEATLNFPEGIFADSGGGLFIADTDNHRIRRVDPTGVITTGAGVALPGFRGPAGEFSVIVKNVDNTFTRTLKDGTKINFNAQGLQTSVVDRNGNATSYSYNPDGSLASITDPAGLVTTLSYTGGKLSSITDPTGRLTQFVHDAQGNLIRVTNPDGAVTQFGYDSNHLLTSKTDPRGFTTAYQYNAAARISSISRPDSSVVNLASSFTVGFVDTTAGLGTETNPAPITTHAQAVSQLTDGNGNVTTFSDSTGAVNASIDPLGRTTLIDRDVNFLPTTITRPNGAVAAMTYDLRGNLLTSAEQAIGATTTFTYEPAFNQVTSIKDPKGNTTTTAYGLNGNPVETTDALGNRTQLSYDSRGLLTSVTSAVGKPEQTTTTFTYDAKGNLATSTDPLGNVTTLTYDSAGNVATSTDAEGRVTTFSYDAMNRLTSVTDPLGGITSYTYDPIGNLISVTDAKAQVASFAYDPQSRLSSSTDPLGSIQSFAYDGNGNLTSTTTRKGEILNFQYDAVNQLVQKTLPLNQATTFSFDVMGNLTSVVDPDSTVNMTYDLVNRMTSSAQSTPSIPTPFTISSTYDLNGNRVTMTDPQAGVTNYVYDALNRLTSLTNPSAQATTFGYDALSRRTSLTHANEMVSSYSYDAASQLLNLSHQLGASTINSFTYTLDRVRNRQTKADTSGTANYTYDALNRLSQATNPIPSNPLETYTYDPVGNRTNSNQNGASVFNQANQLTEDATFTFVYDANGNQIRRTRKATGSFTLYEYDAENRLIRVVREDGSIVNYHYDGLGRRIEKEVDSVVTRYIYDNEDILLELDGSNAITARYTHGPGIDEPLITDRSGQTFFYHVDGLGSATDITDSTGALRQQYVYSSFGKIESQLDAGFVQPYTFTAREFDPETSQYFYRARNYNSLTGRFLQADPIGIVPFGATARLNHLYVYVGNNPTLLNDPSGLQSDCADRTNLKRMAVFGACLGRAFVNNRTAFNYCFSLCFTALITGGAIQPLNIACAACVGVGTAVLLNAANNCRKEADAVPDECSCGV